MHGTHNGKSRHRWEVNIKMGLKCVGCSWTRSFRRRIGTLADSFERGNEHSDSTQCEKLL